MSVMPEPGARESAAFMLTRAWVLAAVAMVPVTVGAAIICELAYYRVIGWAWLEVPSGG